jgi:Ni,Fe-hydrogenase III small subunit
MRISWRPCKSPHLIHHSFPKGSSNSEIESIYKENPKKRYQIVVLNIPTSVDILLAKGEGATKGHLREKVRVMYEHCGAQSRHRIPHYDTCTVW